MKTFIDSDILISHLKGDKKAGDLLRRLTSEGNELWIGALQRLEVVFLMKASEEKETRLFLAGFKTHPLTQEIVDRGAALFRLWNSTNGTAINDAVLAATVELTGGHIYTQNVKNFPMPEIIKSKGW